METRQSSAFRAVIQRHAVLSFYILVFVLQVGLYLLALLGTGFLGTGTEDPTSAADLDALAYLALLPGSLAVAAAAVAVAALAFGRAGLRDLRSRVFHWRVSARWYAVALLSGPLVMTAVLFTLSLFSPAFLPALIDLDDAASLAVGLLVVGVLVPFFEELGWTGFATPELLKRHGVLATGLTVGLLWGVWHLPLYLATASGSVPLVLYAPVMAFSILLPYRVLMVWVFDRTGSVPMAMLMHLSLTVYPFLFLNSPAMVGGPDFIFNLVAGAALWIVVAAVVVADRRRRRTEAAPGGAAAKHDRMQAA